MISEMHISSTAATSGPRATRLIGPSSTVAWVVRMTSSMTRIAIECAACCSRALRVLREDRMAGK
jgi:hypothetical protein